MPTTIRLQRYSVRPRARQSIRHPLEYCMGHAVRSDHSSQPWERLRIDIQLRRNQEPLARPVHRDARRRSLRLRIIRRHPNLLRLRKVKQRRVRRRRGDLNYLDVVNCELGVVGGIQSQVDNLLLLLPEREESIGLEFSPFAGEPITLVRPEPPVRFLERIRPEELPVAGLAGPHPDLHILVGRSPNLEDWAGNGRIMTSCASGKAPALDCQRGHRRIARPRSRRRGRTKIPLHQDSR